tara:strand:- start:2120 stop:3838 length:1719 start_codon:yes stop_codon:yes gene_type:complete
MAQAIRGVNNKIINIKLSNYSLTTQIVIINIVLSILAVLFIVIFNFFLLTSNKNIDFQKKIINSQLSEITNHLSTNAIKRILTFDESCIIVSEEQNREEARIVCKENNLLDKNYEDTLLQLDPIYTQQYIYSNYLKSNFIVKVFGDNWTKFADTQDYSVTEEVLIMDINSESEVKNQENEGFYELYKSFYFKMYNFIQRYFDEQKLNKLKNDNIQVMETIKSKKSTSYMFKDQNNLFKSSFASPIIRENNVYGVVVLIASLTYGDNQDAYQSILLTNFSIFFISIMFLFSILFSKSIVGPIKTLSKITELERDKSVNNKKNIIYPNRNDEIGNLSFDIKSMSNDLKKQINEIEEFAADVSHELKNPLSGLKSSNDLLNKSNISEEKKKLLISNMGKDIDRMNILISDISNYTLTQVEISEEIIQELELINFFEEYNKTLSYKNYFLEIRTNQKKAFVRINKDKFIQVLNNLIDNTLSFTGHKTKILIFIKIENQDCIINFVDQGPGVSLDYKDKIFQRFYTDRLQDRESHTGLGLSIVKNIIESFGGKISLIRNSHKGFEGACFEIKLPLIR